MWNSYKSPNKGEQTSHSNFLAYLSKKNVSFVDKRPTILDAKKVGKNKFMLSLSLELDDLEQNKIEAKAGGKQAFMVILNTEKLRGMDMFTSIDPASI